MPTSEEFVMLCRTQITLLAQEMGVAFSVVYLTQEFVEGGQSQLVPIVAYPETISDYRLEDLLRLTTKELQADRSIAADQAGLSTTFGLASSPPTDDRWDILANSALLSASQALPPPQRQVLPLMHEEVVLGLLVVGRADRPWSRAEQTQLEAIANTLTLACVLDQRYQWLKREHHQQQVFQAQQHDLIDNLLHQLRNSLTALQTFGKLMLKRLLPGDTNRTIADNIVRETDRLKELSQQLEQVSKASLPSSLALPAAVTDIESQVVPPEREETDVGLSMAGFLAGSTLAVEPCQVANVLDPLLAAAQTIAQEKNLRLHHDLPAYLPDVAANPPALREILNNLMENALKYTPAGGQVSVVAQQNGQWVDIAISDTGVGIPAQDLPHLFERHFRGVQANTEIPGSGLGLAIARSLIKQMHGEIQVFSPARDTQLKTSESTSLPSQPGSTFVVRLPVMVEVSHHG